MSCPPADDPKPGDRFSCDAIRVVAQTPANDGQSRPALPRPTSNVNLFRYGKSIVYLDAKISDCHSPGSASTTVVSTASDIWLRRWDGVEKTGVTPKLLQLPDRDGRGSKKSTKVLA
jgi:hypothetical protein